MFSVKGQRGSTFGGVRISTAATDITKTTEYDHFNKHIPALKSAFHAVFTCHNSLPALNHLKAHQLILAQRLYKDLKCILYFRVQLSGLCFMRTVKSLHLKIL